MTKSFQDLGVATELHEALTSQGITHPFPIQELTLPLALAGNDLIGQARTGTGKTLAFGLPLLQRLDPSLKRTQALVVVPTRELCVQVYSDLQIGEHLGVTSVSVYGGVGYDEQTDALEAGAHVVVGTPGRLLDHLNRGTLDLSEVTQLVLDEADEMLDMGFLPDVERLIEACPAQSRHTMLFSATMPTEIVKLARRYMNNPTFTRAENLEVDTAPTVEQHFFQVHRMDKPRVLARILQSPNRKGVFVFVRTKHMADRLVDELASLNTPAIAIHGDLRQATRERNLDRFRAGSSTVLVATEVAARGLDVTDVTHVINYDCPDDDKMYLHRIGRTARAGQDGMAITFAEFNEVSRLDVIRKAIGSDSEVVEVFSTSDELTKRFDLPETTPWAHLNRSNDKSRPRSTRPAKSAPTKSAPAKSGSPQPTTAKSAPVAAERTNAERTETEPASTDRPTSGSSDGSTRTRTRTRTSSTNRSQPRARARRGDSGRDSSRSTGGDTKARSGDARSRGGEQGAKDAKQQAGGRDAQDHSGVDDGKQRSGNNRRRSGNDRKRSGSSGSRNGQNRSSDQQRGADDERGQRRSAPSGEPARGDGTPQTTRRVKVEHLP